MTTKHTPAPWEIKGSLKDGDFWINGESHNYDTVIVANPDFIVSEANAKLIAAAPDLLEALIEIIARYDRYGNHVPMPSADIEKSRAAIAKATQ
jgi:hypothetical protein